MGTAGPDQKKCGRDRYPALKHGAKENLADFRALLLRERTRNQCAAAWGLDIVSPSKLCNRVRAPEHPVLAWLQT